MVLGQGGEAERPGVAGVRRADVARAAAEHRPLDEDARSRHRRPVGSDHLSRDDDGGRGVTDQERGPELRGVRDRERRDGARHARTGADLEERTAGFMYVRLHGHTELYASGYSSRSLDRWAEKVRGWAADGLDVYVYFDNDSRGHAPHDAVALLDRLR